MSPYITQVVTSGDIGFGEAAARPIFLAALKAGRGEGRGWQSTWLISLTVTWWERGELGMKPVLIDRYDLFPGTADCLRLRSLAELARHLFSRRPPVPAAPGCSGGPYWEINHSMASARVLQSW